MKTIIKSSGYQQLLTYGQVKYKMTSKREKNKNIC